MFLPGNETSACLSTWLPTYRFFPISDATSISPSELLGQLFSLTVHTDPGSLQRPRKTLLVGSKESIMPKHQFIRSSFSFVTGQLTWAVPEGAWVAIQPQGCATVWFWKKWKGKPFKTKAWSRIMKSFSATELESWTLSAHLRTPTVRTIHRHAPISFSHKF